MELPFVHITLLILVLSNVSIATPSLNDLTIEQVHARLKEGSLSCVEYATNAYDVLESVGSLLNAFISVTERDVVISEAKKTDEKLASKDDYKLSTLECIPFVVKDNINTKDLPTTGGTQALLNNRPLTDAPVVTKLLNAGGILIGKTNLHELAYGTTSSNAAFGPVHNPYDTELISGGSSGGTAAAIAAGVVRIGLGTDTGGSMRIPASMCGVVGYRPTKNRYNYEGTIRISNRDTIGIMAKTLEEVLLVDEVIKGDDTTVDMQVKDMVFCTHEEHFMDNVDPEIMDVFNAAVKAIKDNEGGIHKMEIDEFSELMANNIFTVLWDTKTLLPEYMKETNPPVTFEDLVSQVKTPGVKAALDWSLNNKGPVKITKELMKQAEQEKSRLEHQFYVQLEELICHALVYPTVIVQPTPVGQETIKLANGKTVDSLLAHSHNMNLASHLGLPAITIPIGFSKSGLPVGMEFTSYGNFDRQLLSAVEVLSEFFPPLDPPKVTKNVDKREL